jgi:formylglycine-generating enzyme required for sulfatase activity
MKFVRIRRKDLFAGSLFIFFTWLFTACSSPATVEQPATLTATIYPPSPTQTIPSPTVVDGTPQPTPTGTALPAMGSTRVIEADQMVQVYVPAGEFTMGSNDEDVKKSLEGGRAYPEIPVNTVYLDGYWIDKYEVNNGQYALCLAAGACKPLHLTSSATRVKYFGNPEYSNYPVIWVSWTMARAYCEWGGRRLPTEAEWEKAARGTDQRRYAWGNDPLDSTRANFCDIHCPLTHANAGFNDGYPETAPVGSFPAGASPYGVMDMAGNVWEWTNTLVRPYPYNAADGREDPKDSPNVDGERVWRGGSWTNGYWWMRASLRYRSKSWYWNSNLGFRCAG